MKKKFITRVLSALVLLVLLFGIPASAAVDPEVQKTSVDAIVKLKLMQGDESGNLKLENKVSRCEFVAMVIRMMGYHNTTDTKDIKVPFTDIKSTHWSYDYIKIAIKHKLLNGYVDNTVRPDNPVSFTEAQAILLRALGYDSTLVGSWPDNVLKKSAELGLDKNISLPKDQLLTRGETSVLIYNSLSISFKK